LPVSYLMTGPGAQLLDLQPVRVRRDRMEPGGMA
jgi:hypothetical protein